MKLNKPVRLLNLLCLLLLLVPLAACSGSSTITRVEILKETDAGQESRSITEPSDIRQIYSQLRSGRKQKGVVDIGSPMYRIILRYENQQEITYSYYGSSDLQTSVSVFLKSPDSEHLYKLGPAASRKIAGYLW